MNVLISDIPKNDRPRERLVKVGAKNLTNEELLSIILRTGRKNESVKVLANEILSNIKDITYLKDITLNNLIKINGVGIVKAITLLSAIELGRRVYSKEEKININLNNTSKIYEYIKDILADKKQEYFYAIYLDSKHNLIDKKLLFKGTLNRSIVHPREIFKYAYLFSSSSIICVHNHPSGDPMPSNEDILLTKKLIEIGKINDINVIDHIIIGNNNYYSFYENGDI